MTKTLLEKDYYPIVAKWLARQYYCFKTDINTGLANSRADVIGIRDTGGDFGGEIETIIVEVKRGKEPFATAAGQSFGYTVYANRVYLADKRIIGFTQDEIMIANHLGVGLIRIDRNNKCSEVLTSPYYKPLTKFNLEFLHRLSLAKCQFCETYFSIGDNDNRYGKLTKQNAAKAILDEKGLVFDIGEIEERKVKFNTTKRYTDRRYLCPECTNLIFSEKK